MKHSPAHLGSQLLELDAALSAIRLPRPLTAMDRLHADIAAARFHLQRPAVPPLVAILGGTGTGKSTLLNRLIDKEIAATSFRRTFTAGPIAIVSRPQQIPDGWLGVPHVSIAATSLPARGELDRLQIVESANDLTTAITLLDTPDIDGDHPAHHAQADRVFRWCDAVIFVVTPEKYQMPELAPYVRLAKRYYLRHVFVMNKIEELAVLEDYRKLTNDAAATFAIARDDAAFDPPAEINFPALRQTISQIRCEVNPEANRNRIGDLSSRARDQIIEPLSRQREIVTQLKQSLRALETPPPGVDVNPLTQQLQRRLQQRSVLYLIGPGKFLDRVRQVPGLLARLPRSTFDLLRGKSAVGATDPSSANAAATLNFREMLIDQMLVVQSRVDDIVRSSSDATAWTAEQSYNFSKIDSHRAGEIADDEIGKLQRWLETQWNATPRDTAMLQKLLKLLPGGEKLTQWSEAAPYILAIVVATHHALFGPVDLMVLGGWSLVTWLTERVSNEVSARARAANRAIDLRFARLAHEQIESTCNWLDLQSASPSQLDRVRKIVDHISESLA